MRVVCTVNLRDDGQQFLRGEHKRAGSARTSAYTQTHTQRAQSHKRAPTAGEPLCVGVEEDEEYDEWEFDPVTGEMVRVED